MSKFADKLNDNIDVELDKLLKKIEIMRKYILDKLVEEGRNNNIPMNDTLLFYQIKQRRINKKIQTLEFNEGFIKEIEE